jgi:hypothetical protein
MEAATSSLINSATQRLQEEGGSDLDLPTILRDDDSSEHLHCEEIAFNTSTHALIWMLGHQLLDIRTEKKRFYR